MFLKFFLFIKKVHCYQNNKQGLKMKQVYIIKSLIFHLFFQLFHSFYNFYNLSHKMLYLNSYQVVN